MLFILNCVSPSAGPRATREVKDRNDIREMISESFETINFWGFPAPVENTRQLNFGFSAADITHDFNSCVTELRNVTLRQLSEPKKFNGTTLSGHVLSALVVSLADALNENAEEILPDTISQAMERKLTDSAKRLAKSDADTWNKRLTEKVSLEPMPSAALSDEIAHLSKVTIAMLEERLQRLAQSTLNSAVQEVHQHINLVSGSIVSKNTATIRRVGGNARDLAMKKFEESFVLVMDGKLKTKSVDSTEVAQLFESSQSTALKKFDECTAKIGSKDVKAERQELESKLATSKKAMEEKNRVKKETEDQEKIRLQQEAKWKAEQARLVKEKEELEQKAKEAEKVRQAQEAKYKADQEQLAKENAETKRKIKEAEDARQRAEQQAQLAQQRATQLQCSTASASCPSYDYGGGQSYGQPFSSSRMSSSSSASTSSNNSWNDHQAMYGGMGYSKEQIRDMYYASKGQSAPSSSRSSGGYNVSQSYSTPSSSRSGGGLSWNAFQASVGGQGYSRAQIQQMYHKHK
jgi:chemotaxis protein histidine kinase CheA